jgi:cobalamin biosynthesis protein CobD/CbiB
MNLKFFNLPDFWLRLGIGLMYLYSGFDLFVNPQHWYGFVPQWLSQSLISYLTIENYLKIQGAGEFLLGLIILAWFLPKFLVQSAVILAILEMILILLFIGIDPITFRDIGLLGGSLALIFLLK